MEMIRIHPRIGSTNSWMVTIKFHLLQLLAGFSPSWFPPPTEAAQDISPGHIHLLRSQMQGDEHTKRDWDRQLT